jgi:hypothetical protein
MSVGQPGATAVKSVSARLVAAMAAARGETLPVHSARITDATT